jgi:hypothetical protein
MANLEVEAVRTSCAGRLQFERINGALFGVAYSRTAREVIDKLSVDSGEGESNEFHAQGAAQARTQAAL